MKIQNWSRILSKLALVATSLVVVQIAQTATVTQATIDEWNHAVDVTRAQVLRQASAPERSLDIGLKSAHLEKVAAGAIIAEHSPEGGMVPVPSGLIHHWIGMVYMAGVRLADLLQVLQDYDHYDQVFPSVINSKLVSRSADKFRYRLKFEQHGFGIRAGMLGTFDSSYFRLDSHSGYSVTEAASLDELAGAGTGDERALSLTESHGYIEKMFTVVRYREDAGGVNLQLETLTLSRDVPASVRWLVSPVIHKFSRQVMVTTLDRLRDRVQGSQTQLTAPPEQVSMRMGLR